MDASPPSSPRKLQPVIRLKQLRQEDSGFRVRISFDEIGSVTQFENIERGNSGCFLRLRATDGDDVMPCVAFGDEATKLQQMLQQDKVYVVSGAVVKPSKEGNKQLRFDAKTKFEDCFDALPEPALSTFDDLPAGGGCVQVTILENISSRDPWNLACLSCKRKQDDEAIECVSCKAKKLEWRVTIQAIVEDPRGHTERISVFEPMALDLLQVSGNLAGPAKFAAVDAAMTQLEGIKAVIRVGVTKRFSSSDTDSPKNKAYLNVLSVRHVHRAMDKKGSEIKQGVLVELLKPAEIEPLVMIKEEPELKMPVKSELIQRGVAGTSSKKLIKSS